MIQRYRSVPQFLYRQTADALRGRRRAASIGIIGGADGPTAVFVARRKRKDRDDGHLLFSPDWRELALALSLAGGAVLLVAGLSGLLYHRSANRPLKF